MAGEAITCTLANLKGGVSKSTTCVNLAIMAALLGKRVLLVDADLQGNATSALGYEAGLLERTTYTVMTGRSSFAETVLPTYFDKVSHAFLDPARQEQQPQRRIKEENLMRGPDVLPCNIGAARAENELIHHPNWGGMLKHTLRSVRDRYDYIFIDTNPGLGKMTVNAFICSDYVIIPTVPERWPTDGILILCSSIEEARMFNPDLRVAGLLFTRVRYAEHTRLMTYIKDVLLPRITQQYPDIPFTSFQMFINESAAFAAATNKRSSIILANPTDAVALASWGFFAELLQRIQSPDFPLVREQYQRLLAAHKQAKEKVSGEHDGDPTTQGAKSNG